MKNDNDWIEYLRKEEKSFLPEPPEGLWNNIKDNLPSKEKRHLVVPLWLRYCGAAACIALTFGIGIRLMDTSSDKRLSHEGISVKKLPAKTDDASKAHLPQTTMTQKVLAHLATSLSTLTQEEAAVVADTMEQQSTTSPATLPNGDTPISKGDAKGHTHSHGNHFIAYDNVKNRHRQGIVSLSLFGGNLIASNTSSQGGYDILTNGSYKENVSGNPYEDIETLNQGSETDTKKRYSLPLRAGVRVSLPVNDHLSVESGVTYTQLSSTTESGSTDNYYSTKQVLHYIGIPLKLRYKLWQGKSTAIYVSGGGMAEKCIHGKTKTDFYIGGDKHSDIEQTVNEHQLQLSATLSAGIETNITKGVSLFVEPGVNYYFYNHSDIDNAYKNKPLNVDLSIGIRLNVNQ